MDLKDLSVATMTWARTHEETALLKLSLDKLTSFGIPVFVTDGGSSEEFISYIQKLPDVHLCEPAKGLWLQTKTSLKAACNSRTKFILYTEPDKLDFFSAGLLPLLEKISLANETGVVVVARSPHAFESFPNFQQSTERTINFCCAEVMGKDTDYVYGPFLLNRKIVSLLDHFPEHAGWGWRPYAFNLARRKGFRIESFEGDFFCPAAQRSDSPGERIYRMKQLAQNIEGLTLSTQAALE